MELRPCFDGYAGIPQETRLLFSSFARSNAFEVGGLLNAASSKPARDRTRKGPREGLEMFAQSRRLIALDSGEQLLSGGRRIARKVLPDTVMRRFELLERWGRTEKLDTLLDPELFEDWLWIRLFQLGLTPQERHLLRNARYPIPQLEWHRSVALASTGRSSAWTRLDMAGGGWDIHLAQTPSPYRLLGGKMVIRYHDAIPLLWPHTISHSMHHANGHFRMLAANVEDGAWFVCTSEPVREDLLRIFPSAERRTVTIPTMSSAVFHPDRRPPDEIRSIIGRGRRAAARRMAVHAGAVQAGTVQAAPDAEAAPSPEQHAPPRDLLDEPFILSVSTLEPRKNYGFLMRAAALARRGGARFRLVIVANPGWRSEKEAGQLRQLVAEGVVYHLVDVTSVDLRALYTAAHAVICPSRAEGFDLATVEAMACGAPLLASDIPVHRWVCGEAATYFDAYDETALATLLTEVAAQDRDQGRLAEMSDRSLRQAKAYARPDLERRWEDALHTVAAGN